MRRWIDRPRDEFVVSTKVGRLLRPRPNPAGDRDDEGFDVPADYQRVRDYTRDGVLRSLDASLQRLGLDRVDIVFVHDPDDYYEAALDEVFPTLEELRGQGVVRSYGAGMNQSAMLARFVERTDLDIVMLAGRYTLLEQGALADLLPLCLARDVSVVAAGVFNSGILAQDRPDPSAHYNYETVDPDVLSRARQIADVCARHDVPLPVAAMAFVSAHPGGPHAVPRGQDGRAGPAQRRPPRSRGAERALGRAAGPRPHRRGCPGPRVRASTSARLGIAARSPGRVVTSAPTAAA